MFELYPKRAGVQAERAALLGPLDDGDRPDGVGAEGVVTLEIHDAKANERSNSPASNNPDFMGSGVSCGPESAVCVCACDIVYGCICVPPCHQKTML